VTDWFDRLTTDGYALLTGVFGPSEVALAREACAVALADHAGESAVLSRAGAEPHGARDLLRLWPGAAGLAHAPVLASAIRRTLGPDAGLVRALYFDKPPGHGWALPWHRDTTIAVKSHLPDGRFEKPTFKSGIPHVEAPTELLRRMVSARIHLDAMTDENGPLRVLPGSHKSEVEDAPADRGGVTLRCEAGDVLLMRPRLLHASSGCPAGHDGHRRVVHLEFAADPALTGGYEWHTFVPLRRV
jgi:ectoine hydroxylase-related dioxygenase (phytanoyl-CoA dioxygenase family)